MAIFIPITSPWYGMTEVQLRAAVAKAQIALVNLETGSQAESMSYSQGDGAKSVSYSRANIPALKQTINEWVQLLNPGVRIRARRPMRLYF